MSRNHVDRLSTNFVPRMIKHRKTPFNPRCPRVLALARVLESIADGVVLMNLWGQ